MIKHILTALLLFIISTNLANAVQLSKERQEGISPDALIEPINQTYSIIWEQEDADYKRYKGVILYFIDDIKRGAIKFFSKDIVAKGYSFNVNEISFTEPRDGTSTIYINAERPPYFYLSTIKNEDTTGKKWGYNFPHAYIDFIGKRAFLDEEYALIWKPAECDSRSYVGLIRYNEDGEIGNIKYFNRGIFAYFGTVGYLSRTGTKRLLEFSFIDNEYCPPDQSHLCAKAFFVRAYTNTQNLNFSVGDVREFTIPKPAAEEEQRHLRY